MSFISLSFSLPLFISFFHLITTTLLGLVFRFNLRHLRVMTVHLMTQFAIYENWIANSVHFSDDRNQTMNLNFNWVHASRVCISISRKVKFLFFGRHHCTFKTHGAVELIVCVCEIASFTIHYLNNKLSKKIVHKLEGQGRLPTPRSIAINKLSPMIEANRTKYNT